MTKWQATFLGLKHLPRDLSGFEIEAFFTFTLAERQMIEERRRPALKLGLALQIGFLRMSGRLLDSVRIVPPALWRHLGEQFGVQAPDLASLRAMYRRHRTVYEHQELACWRVGAFSTHNLSCSMNARSASPSRACCDRRPSRSRNSRSIRMVIRTSAWRCPTASDLRCVLD